MEETINTIVIAGGDEKTLEIKMGENVLTFSIEGETLFLGDWTDNFLDVFERALEIWKLPEEEEQ